MDTQYAVGYLQAFFDGEGGVYFSKPPSRGGLIMAANTEIGLLEHCRRLFEHLGIKAAVAGPYKASARPRSKPLYRVEVRGKNSMLEFAKRVGFQSLVKQRKLNRLVAYYTRPEARRCYNDPPTREQLLDLYVRKGLSQDATGVALGYRTRCGSAISVWLRRYGIPTRRPGGNHGR